MSSFYVTYPGFENHSLALPGHKSIKVGIFKGKHNGQKYVNKRYGQSTLHLCVYKPDIDFESMKTIEKLVLTGLEEADFSKQHGKREHFIIPNSKTRRKEFVTTVNMLYAVYCAASGFIKDSH